MKKPIHTPLAPAAIGPYSQAISSTSGNLVFLSGQIPLDPTTGEITHGDFEARTRQVFQNISAVCAAAGGSLNQIIKLNIYLLDMANFPIVNSVMSELFNQPYPARATIAVMGLPKNADIEIEAILAL